MSDLEVKYPVQVVAVDALGGVPLRPGAPDELAADLLNAAGHLLSWLDGHGKCGFWGFDRAAGLFTCACGSARYQIGDPVAAETAVA